MKLLRLSKKLTQVYRGVRAADNICAVSSMPPIPDDRIK